MRNFFTRAHRIGGQSEIRNILRTGLRWRSRSFNINYLPNTREHDRMAVLLPKGFGSSVERNRAKRVVREIFRKHRRMKAPYFDCLFRLHGSFSFARDECLNDYHTWLEFSNSSCCCSFGTSSKR